MTIMVTRFQFNTSRLYTEEGQVIVVEYDPLTGEAKFHDVSRMIWGEVQIEAGLDANDEYHRGRRKIAEQVMSEYDHLRYKHHLSSMDVPRRDKDEVVHLYRI